MPKAQYSGFLKKKGAVNKSYRTRWFEIVGSDLNYYKSTLDRIPKGVINMKNCKVEEDKSKMYIKISGEHLPRTYELIVVEKEEFDDWVRVLNEATVAEESSTS